MVVKYPTCQRARSLTGEESAKEVLPAVSETPLPTSFVRAPKALVTRNKH